MKPGLERRRFTQRVEVRKVRRDGSGAEISIISGHGAVFNQETVIGNWFRERIEPGAFAPLLGANCDVRALFNHDSNYVLGRTSAGTLRLSEDADGLAYEADVNQDDPQAVGVAARVARKDVTGSSFSFRVKREEWIEPDDGTKDLPLRVIHEFADLYDVGPVTFPAYEGASSEARSAVVAVLGRESLPAGVRRSLLAGLEVRTVPKNVSTKKAPTDTPWSAPGLGDFTSKGWGDLTDAERTNIAGHFAWKDGDRFADLHLPHHRASDGAIVLRGVTAAAQRISATEGIDKSAVQAHLEAHYHAFNLKAPWEKDASSEREIEAAIRQSEARSDTDGEEAAELVRYQSIQALGAQARTALEALDGIVSELIASETETPTETPDAEAAEEAVEAARIQAVLAHCRQVAGAINGITELAQCCGMANTTSGAAAEPAAAAAGDGDDDMRAADADRVRRLRLAEASVGPLSQGV